MNTLKSGNTRISNTRSAAILLIFTFLISCNSVKKQEATSEKAESKSTTAQTDSIHTVLLGKFDAASAPGENSKTSQSWVEGKESETESSVEELFLMVESFAEVVTLVEEAQMLKVEAKANARTKTMLSKSGTFNYTSVLKKANVGYTSYYHANNNQIIAGNWTSTNTGTTNTRTFNAQNAQGSYAIEQEIAEEKEDAKAGILTGSELNDFAKWDLWKDLTEVDLRVFSDRWRIKPNERYTVQVSTEESKPIIDCEVQLINNRGETIWTARTDNTGKAELWVNSFDTESIGNGKYSIKATYLGRTHKIKKATKFQDGINKISMNVYCNPPDLLDVLFVVDATGSMEDEINYLKEELMDIIARLYLDNKDLDISLGSLFYKCVGNSYTTLRSEFSKDLSKTIDFIKERTAREGGVEAVEIALAEAVDSMAWRDNTRAKLLFLILDEAPGMDDSVVTQLNATIKKAAEKGIRIIPIVSSGVTDYDKDKSLEYLMRSMALSTNGTYVFLTDHSGVGNKHATPSTDSYDVEILNDLMLRLFHQFTYVTPCEADFADVTGNGDTVYVYNKLVIDHVIVDSSLAARKPDIKDEDDESTKDDEADEDIDKARSWKSFKIYPNPTRGDIYVEIDGSLDHIYLADIRGKLLRQIPVNDQEKIHIDMSELPNGIYVITGLTKDRKMSGRVTLVH